MKGWVGVVDCMGCRTLLSCVAASCMHGACLSCHSHIRSTARPCMRCNHARQVFATLVLLTKSRGKATLRWTLVRILLEFMQVPLRVRGGQGLKLDWVLHHFDDPSNSLLSSMHAMHAYGMHARTSQRTHPPPPRSSSASSSTSATPGRSRPNCGSTRASSGSS